MLCLVAQSHPTLQHRGLWATRLLCPWGFSRQEYWSGLPCAPPGNFPDPGIEPRSPALQADSCLNHQGNPGTPWKLINATNQGFLLTTPTPPPWPPRDTPLPVCFPECRGMTPSCSLSSDPSLQWSRLCHRQPEPQNVCWYHFHVSLHWSWSPLLRLQALCP